MIIFDWLLGRVRLKKRVAELESRNRELESRNRELEVQLHERSTQVIQAAELVKSLRAENSRLKVVIEEKDLRISVLKTVK